MLINSSWAGFVTPPVRVNKILAAPAQPTGSFIITGGTSVVASGAVQLVGYNTFFTNNGTYTDAAGTFSITNGGFLSSTGTTHLNIFNGNTANFGSLVSVYNTANLLSGSNYANNNLFIRSDVNSAANVVIDGAVYNNIKGIVASATVTNGSAPYNSTLSVNASGTALYYQWQSSPDSSTWTSIIGASTSLYTANVTATKYYRVKVYTWANAFYEFTAGVKLNYVCTPTSSITYDTICSSSLPYYWNGLTFTAAGSQTAHLTNTAGCDSAATLNLVVKASSSGTTYDTICTGGSYSWNGTLYNTTGSYTAHLTNAVGCDSAATLNLTVKAASSSTTYDTVCSSSLPIIWNSTLITAAGSQTVHLNNAVGCDSAATLILTVKASSTSTTNASICSGNTYTFNGMIFNQPISSFTVHLTNAAGCDSTATLNLTVNATSTSATYDTICNGGSYTWNGTTYTTAGSYTVHLTNAAGCDSAATLNLTVNATSFSNSSGSICVGGSYTWNGTTYTTAGIYTVHLTNAAGCDSAATLYLSLNTAPSVNKSDVFVTMEGKCFTSSTRNPTDDYQYNGLANGKNAYDDGANTNLDFDGTKWEIYYYRRGRTTMLFTNTTSTSGVFPPISGWVADSASCYGSTAYVSLGNTYCSGNTVNDFTGGPNFKCYTDSIGGSPLDPSLLLATGTYYLSRITSNCESPRSAIGIYVEPTHNTYNGAACDTVWAANLSPAAYHSSLYFTTSGVYTESYTNSNGCPSVDTFNITINKGTHNVSTQTACDSLIWNGTTYTASGTYTYSYNNSNGCPSVDTLYLTVNYHTKAIINVTASGSYTWHGTTYTASGAYIFDTTNATGCDSLTTLNLTITPALPTINTWTGNKSTDWFGADNWTIGVPTSTTDATIPVTTNKPIIASGSASVHNLAIDAGETLTNNATLNVSGDLTNKGTLTNGNYSNVVLLGTGTLSGNNTFNNLEVQGIYNVGSTTADKISVTGILKKTSGSLNTSDKLTLISNASGSALIEEVNGILVGKAYIQHFTSGNFGYHHFSSPVSSATVSSWSNSFPITGANGASSWVSSKVGTLQWYDEIDNTTSLLDSSYYNYTSLSGALIPGKGFTAWLNSLPTLNTFGTPNTGTITIPVTHTSGKNDPRGWNFVGNPYPSPISWTALKSINPGLFGDASCYLWKSTGGKNGIWQAFNGTAGVNGAGDIINSSLGFFVYVNASGTLTFKNSVRNYSYLSPAIFGTSSSTDEIRVSVNDLVSGETDEAVAYTSSSASISRKMQQPLEAMNPTIGFNVNGTMVAINTLKGIDANTELPLVISTPVAGNYSLKFTANNLSLPVYLKDAVTGTYTDVKANGEVFITTTATETANRYSLVFSQPIAEAASSYNVFAKANNIVVTNPANTGATIVVYNTLGQQVAKAIATSTTTTITVSLISAHYVVKIMDSKGANVVKQVIVK